MTRQFKSSLHTASLLLALMSLVSVVVEAQSSQYDKGTPPQHAVGVSSLGSYASTELGTINLANGALNFRIPLGSIGGRGMTIPLTLNYSSKVWSASMDVDTERESGTDQSVAYADFDAGITQGGDLYRMIGAGWTIAAGPSLDRKIVKIGIITSGSNTGCYGYAVAKLTLYLPDRGEIDFRDDAYDGEPLARNCSTGATASRGTRWHATDGSGTIFINDVTNGVANEASPNLSGTVITGDGTRVFFNSTGGITDRNGNRITGDNAGGFIDQLGRTTTIQHNVADPADANVTLAVLVTVPGYGGPRYYKIKTGVMNQNYRSGINPTLPVINGDWDPEAWGYGWGTATRLFAKSYGTNVQEIDNVEVLTEVILPDGRSLKFKYNQFGEVAEVELPTGGKVQYEYGYSSQLPTGVSPSWETGTNGAGSGIVTDVKQVDRVVTAKRTYPDGGSTPEGKWGFTFGSSTCVVDAYDSNNTHLSDVRHYFLASGRYTEDYDGQGNHDGTHYNLWSSGLEYLTEVRDSTGNVLSATEHDWTQRASLSWSSYGQEQPANDNRVTEARRILDDSSTAKTQTFYQPNVKYNNPAEVKEYDFDNSLKRRTTTTYADSSNLINNTDYSADSIHLLSLPLVQIVYDGSSNQVAQTVNEYDNYADDGNRAPLQNYASVTQHNSSYGASYLTRGNLTRTAVWLNVTNSFIYSYPRYDIVGNVISAKDPKGNVSSMSFADDFGYGSNPGGGTSGTYGATYAFPTLLTSPPPNSGEQTQTARSQYDFSTGQLTGFKDRNGIITQTIYDDPFNRPTQVKAALGISGIETHSKTFYAPQVVSDYSITLYKNDVLTVSDQTTVNDANFRSWTRTDGFGRTVEAWSRDPSGDVKVVTQYDALGRAFKQSNPFRPSLSETAIYTTSAFDFAGRMRSVTTPDSAMVSTDYAGSTVTVTDQAGRSRKSVTDALGRLTKVYEDPSNLNYLTTYDYDTLDNLTTVTQGTQTPRSFAYDSLKRLTSASNPESGAICYGTVVSNQCQANGYDANGNLILKTDARSILTTYSYDALNRLTNRTYSDNTTPSVTYTYDTATNGKGRLASVGSSVSSYSYASYDPLGRVNSGSQTIYGQPNQTYAMTYTYDLAGHVKTISYPSNHTVSYSYDNAGRTSSFSGYLGDGTTNRTYSTGITYSALGGMTQEQFGTTTPIYNKLFYNSRGQLAEIREGLTGNDTSWRRGAIINFYSTCWGMCGGSNSTTQMTDNSGNLKTQQVFIPQVDDATYGDHFDVLSESFDYDSLNRLANVHDGSNWKQEYSYDRFGNRTIHQTNTSITGIVKYDFAVSTVNNRLYGPGETVTNHPTMNYDDAGNQIKDTYSAAAVNRVYDAENRMTKETQASGDAGTYSYDGDGRRVKRIVGTTETWQVYGMGGELLAEYAANTAASTPQKEYGYRNGQLLITATVTAAGGWGTPPPLDDNPLNPPNQPKTDVRAIHITQLRTAINALRAHYNLGAYQWQKPTASNGAINNSVLISWEPIDEMRTAVDQALGAPTPAYTGGLAQNQPILAAHIQELRDRVLAAWNSGSSGGVDIRWLVSDQLGTPRMIFDQSGSLANTSRHDYLPFGEELFAGTAGRTTALGYTNADGARQKFTLKERDIETGLDYFLARYYSSTQGRFTSPDEFTGGPEETGVLGSGHPEKQALKYAEVTNPQSLNKYQYCFNNPLRFIDPDGQEPQDSYELRLRRDEKALLEKRMSPEEFRARRNAEGVGAVVGLSAVLMAVYGPEAATAVFAWAARNPEAATLLANEAVQISSGNPAPSSSGLTTAELGLAREGAVAALTKGTVVRQPITVANVGRSEIDVIGGAGEYIAVGGPGKMAANLGQLGKQLSILRTAAERNGTKAVAYFAKGTPEAVLKVARRRLGAENVHLFEDVKK